MNKSLKAEVDFLEYTDKSCTIYSTSSNSIPSDTDKLFLNKLCSRLKYPSFQSVGTKHVVLDFKWSLLRTLT